MQDIPFAQLLVLLAFILVPLINLLLERLRRRYHTQPPRQESARQPAPRTFVKPPPLDLTVPARERVSAPELAEALPRPRSRRRKKVFFTSRRDLQRAVILMTVLGPCRALDQADDR